MKNTFRKSSLISSVAILLVAIVALSGTTFAWFSQQDNASAGTLSMSATTASGLYIVESDAATSTAPTEGWSSKITWTAQTTQMNPVSTGFTSTTPSFFTTSTDKANGAWNNAQKEDGTYVYPITAATAGTDYIVKRIWVKADTTDDVTLTITPTVVGGKGYERLAIVNGTKTQVMGNAVETVNGFINQNGETAEIATTAYSNFVYEGKLDTAQYFDVYCWFEGQDAQCMNTNSGSSFTVDLAFGL